MKSIVVSFISLICIFQLSCSEQNLEDVYVFDADVPGTKVFFGDELLGEAPIRITKNKLVELGIPLSGQDEVVLDNDGWGEGLILGLSNGDEYKIHFLASDTNAYFAAQTPWGKRTRTSGASSNGKNHYKVKLNGRSTEVIQVNMTVLKDMKSALLIRVNAINTGNEVLSGKVSKLNFHWGSMRTPWQKRQRYEVQLPEEWTSFEVNEEHSIELEIPVKSNNKGVSLFCTMDLLDESKKLIGKGTVYSDSVWVP